MRFERAFAFIDLSGFTRFTHVHGDGAAREVLTAFRSAVRSVVDEQGTRVAKWLGDGAMVVSVELEPLVSTVIETHRRTRASNLALAVRSGITLGDVIVFEGDDYIGSTVNLAARLCDQAGADEILAHRPVADRLDARFGRDPVGRLQVPGLDDSVDVVRILSIPRPYNSARLRILA